MKGGASGSVVIWQLVWARFVEFAEEFVEVVGHEVRAWGNLTRIEEYDLSVPVLGDDEDEVAAAGIYRNRKQFVLYAPL